MGSGCSKINTNSISVRQGQLHKIIKQDPTGESKAICILHPIDTRDSTEYPILIHVTNESHVVIENLTTKFVLVSIDAGGSIKQPPQTGRYVILVKGQIIPNSAIVGVHAYDLWDKAEWPIFPLYVPEAGYHAGAHQNPLPDSSVIIEITDEGVRLLGSDPNVILE